MIQRRYGSGAIALFILCNLFALTDPRASFAQGSEPSVGPEVSAEQPTSGSPAPTPEIASEDERLSGSDGDQSPQPEKPAAAPAPVSVQGGAPGDGATDEAVTGDGAPRPGPAPESTVVEYEPPPENIPEEPVPATMRRRIWGLRLELGMGFGGDDLVTAYYSDGSEETLQAGTGFSATIGTTVTPFYSEGHAFGFGLDFGIKGWNIGGNDTDFQINMTRLPLLLSGIYSFSVSDSVDLLAAAGAQLEFNPNVSGSGETDDIEIEFDTAVGGYLEAGVMFGNPYFGVDIALRYTFIKYTSDEIMDEFAGNNIGFFLRIHFGLLTTPKS
jgi:hypothetical protein